MKLCDVRPRHVLELLQALKAKGTIAGKTQKHVYGTFRTMLRDAVFAELIASNPCAGLPRGLLPSGASTPRKIYELPAVASLLTDERVPEDRRVFYSLAALTGMRHGEVAGRRWRDYDPKAEPLGCLSVDTQYDDQPLKTAHKEPRPRRVPVHPELAKVLAAWKLGGFAKQFGRPPRDDDFIVPSRRDVKACRTVRLSLRNLVERDCVKLGTSGESFHGLRHSFITHCRRGGARKDVLERVTHNAAGDVLDAYTHWDWAPLCEAVLCFRLPVRPAEVVALPLRVNDSARPIYVAAYDVQKRNAASGETCGVFQRGGRDSNPGENVASGHDLSPNVTRPGEGEGSGSDVRRPVRPERGGASDDSEATAEVPLADCTGVVETAIAAALKLAAEAQQWDIVAQLARELEARRRSVVAQSSLGLPPTDAPGRTRRRA